MTITRDMWPRHDWVSLTHDAERWQIEWTTDDQATLRSATADTPETALRLAKQRQDHLDRKRTGQITDAHLNSVQEW
jgi:hypothetical protein